MESEFKVSCSYMEIYNERIFDLLTDLSNPDQVADFTIAEDRDGRGVHVRGMTEIEVSNENEALNLLFSGELARTTATHKLNRKSNRSHAIFTVYLQQRQRSGISEKVIHSKLHLVDLAGSERLKKTMESIDGSITVDDITRKESMCINQSLSYLEQCVVALSRKGAAHIPYRQSKLTSILKDCLGANCNTLLIACIWGEAQHLEETVSTLRLATRMMKVQNETAQVETIDESALVKKQAKLIKALKQELLMHDALVERTGVGYEPYTPEQQSSIRQMLLKYVEASETEEEDVLNIDSYRQMIEICKQFKIMILASRVEVMAAKEDALRAAGGEYFGNSRSRLFNSTDAGAHDFIERKLHEDQSNMNSHYVGEPDKERSGFSLGIAANDARPATTVEPLGRQSELNKQLSSKPLNPRRAGAGGGAPGAGGQRSPRPEQSQSKAVGGVGGDSSVASVHSETGVAGGFTFEVFVKGEGTRLYADFVSSRSKSKAHRAKVRDGTTAVNAAKEVIDNLQADIAARKASRISLLRGSGMRASEAEDIVDEEEFRLMKELREAKRSYKNGYEQLTKDKALLEESLELVEARRAELVSSFQTWLAKKQRDLNVPGATLAKRGGAWESPSLEGSEGISDQLDDHEAFERLEVNRVMAKDPESLAFFQAQKTRRAHLTQHGASIRLIHKNKRLI